MPEEFLEIGHDRFHSIHSLHTFQDIARQRLGKHIPARANERKNRTSIVKQRITKQASLTTEAVLSMGSLESGYKEVFGSREQ
jgi:hypothetical protein